MVTRNLRHILAGLRCYFPQTNKKLNKRAWLQWLYYFSSFVTFLISDSGTILKLMTNFSNLDCDKVLTLWDNVTEMSGYSVELFQISRREILNIISSVNLGTSNFNTTFLSYIESYLSV